MSPNDSNKQRLYLAYWARKPASEGDEHFHIGLILSPKKPKIDNTTAVTIYHVINTIDITPSQPLERWRFDTRSSRPRTARLTGCMLLGKVPPNFTKVYITEILRSIAVPDPWEASQKKWRCRHWVFAALKILVEKGIIPELPDTPEVIWEIGKKFIDAEGLLNHDLPPHTCNTSGEKIASEMGIFVS